MSDELRWYLSGTGPRVEVGARLDVTDVARAVATWLYDSDNPRQASRDIATMTRRTVEVALSVAVADNPRLLSPKKRERQQLMPAAVDQRLTAKARKRLRELYPEIADVERAADIPYYEREHPAVRTILSNFYPGSGGGRPRVPKDYPVLLTEIASGLLDVARATGASKRAELEQLTQDALNCHSLCLEVGGTCETLRRHGRELCHKLQSVSELDSAGSRANYEAEDVRASLDRGHLPYANSEVLPVGQYGMAPRWGLDPLVKEFAIDNQAAYEEIDRYGQIAMTWARHVALRTRKLLPPYIPVADATQRDEGSDLLLGIDAAGRGG